MDTWNVDCLDLEVNRPSLLGDDPPVVEPPHQEIPGLHRREVPTSLTRDRLSRGG